MVHLIDSYKKKFSREKYEKDIEALKNENDSEKLADFALNNDFSNIRLEAAIKKLHNEFVLADLASNDSNKVIRQFASERLVELGLR